MTAKAPQVTYTELLEQINKSNEVYVTVELVLHSEDLLKVDKIELLSILKNIDDEASINNSLVLYNYNYIRGEGKDNLVIGW